MNGSPFVLGAILGIWAGVFLYLVVLDRKVSRLSREVKRHEG